MTDVLNREEVMETTMQALTLPTSEYVIDNVQRFGFEYEMLPTHMRDGRYRGDDYDDDCCCEYDEDDDCTYTCASCRRDDSDHHGPGGSGDLIERFCGAGLIGDTDQHEYHCDCSTCSYTRSHPLMTAQTDCTVAVEFVSRICDLRDDDWQNDVHSLVNVMNQWKRDGHWMPDGSYSCGNHVHVSHRGDNDTGEWPEWAVGETTVKRHIDALYAVFDWTTVADGGCGHVRGYNRKPGKNDGYGNWLSWRDETAEHRVWNTPREPERLWAHIGLSIALTRWGFAVARSLPGHRFWDTGNYRSGMSDQVYDTITHNIEDVKHGIRAYIPPGSEFDIARKLIHNLRPMAY